MTMDAWNLAAILAMALVTYATRVAGALAIRRWQPAGRAAQALEAVPAAVLTAVIAPTALATGPAETAAAALTALAATRLPLVAVVLFGVAAVVVLRLALG